MKKLAAMILVIGLLLALGGAPHAGTIIWVTDNTDGGNPPSPDDIGWANLLTAQGHTVNRDTSRKWRTLDATKIAELNAADLVIVSRDTDSGAYDDGSEVADWNAVTAPLMMQSQYLVRSSRWKWLNTGGTSGTGNGVLEVIDTGHAIFQGVTLGAGDTVDIATSSTPLSNATSAGNGQLLAIDPDNNRVAIAFWDTGTEFYSGAGQTAGGPRMFFGAGVDGNNPKGAYNLTADGETIFLNAVEFLAPSTPVLTWDGVLDGNWSESVRWTGPKPPNFPDATVKAEIGPLGANNTVTVNGNYGAHTLDITNNGALVVGSGNTLDVVNSLNAAGRPITMQNNSTLLVGAPSTIGSLTTQGNATIGGAGDVSVSGSTFDGGGVTGTFTKTGPGTLSLDNSDGTGVIGVQNLTFDVHEGTLYSIGAQPLGGTSPTTGVPPAVILSGGTLSVRGSDVVIPDSLRHFGYHINNDGLALDLDNNGGMMGGGDPTTFQNFYGQASLTDGPGGRGLDFNNDADFINTGAIGQIDNYSNLWVGTLTVTPGNAGNWELRNAGDDDRAGIWLDLDQDGVFESSTPGLGSNRGEQLSWESGSTYTNSLAAGDYLIAFTHREGGGGSRADFRFKSPTMGGQVIIKPADPAQAGLWSSTGIGPIDMTGTNFTVTADSRLNAISEVGAAFGPLTLGDGTTLTTTGADMTFTSVAVAGGGGRSSTLAVENLVTVANYADGGTATTLIMGGGGTLKLDNTAAGLSAPATTFQVDSGTLHGTGANLLGGPPDVTLNGGELLVEGPAVTVGAIAHYGYHINNDNLALNLHNNAGMMGGGDPTTGPSFYGQAVLTDGPGGRGLDFNNDADFRNTGAVNQNDNYSNLFVGMLHVTAATAGDWELRSAQNDDRSGIWIDLNQNGIFESTSAGLGDNRGEQRRWNDNTVTVVNLAPGDYMVGLVHREGGGGSGIEYRVRAPGMSGQETIKPTALSQFGMWAPVPFAPSTAIQLPGAIDMTGTTFTVTDDSRLTAMSQVGADFGPVTVHDGAALTTGGATPGITFTQAMLPGGRSTYKPEVPTTLTGTLGLPTPSTPTTLVAAGTSDLILDRAPAGSMADVTFEAKSGRLFLDYGSGDPTGGADLLATGGTIAVQGAPGTGYAYGRVNYAFYDNAASNNLQNIDDGVDNAGTNDGLFDLTPTPEASWPSQVQGKALWTGEVWQGGNISNTYCQMWSGRFKAPTTGTYEFYVHGDDYEILWIDRDGDHDFEASNNEDISRNIEGEEGWNTPHTETVTLQGGTVYDFALAHREGGGGDNLRVTIKKPGGSAERINPSAASQQGWWAGDGPLTEAVDMQNTLTVDNVPADALRHLGYHTGPNGVMDLDNNNAGGMMGGGDPTQGPTFFGEALLINGPGGRGLDFNDDNDFINTGAIGRNDNYSNLWLGTLHVDPSEVGNWEFRNAGDDDRAGIWLDLDQDGVFESTTPGLGSNRGEQLSWEDGGTKTVSLVAGDYIIAFTHSEGGGGSRADFRFKSPSMGGQVIIKPGDAGQAGLWSTTPISTLELITDLDANLRELILKNGDLRITGAQLLTVEQASVSTATSGTVGLITETNTILTDVLGFNGNGQTVEITKAGGADLILDKAGTGLAGATFNVKGGRLVGYASGNPFGGAALKLNGGDLLLSASLGSASPVDYDNPVTVEADAMITAGQSTGGQPAPMTVNLGSAGNNVSVAAGRTLTIRSTDNYSLNVAGQVNGGNLMVSEGTVALSGGGTLANMEVKTAATASTPGVTITDGGRYTARDGDLTVSGSGASFEVGGVDLGTAPDRLGILGGTVTVAGPTVIPTSGLVGKWTFDDDTANDSSGNNHHGQARDGAAYSSDVPAILAGGRSIDLTSGNAHVLVDTGGNQDVFDLDTITVATWVKRWPDGSWEPYISKRGEGGQGWQLRRQGGSDRLTFTLRGTSGADDPQGNSNVIQQNQSDWHHIVATYDGSTRQWFVNGVLDYTMTESGNISNTNHWLVFGARSNSGSDPNNIGNHSHVQLDDIYIYDRAVTEAEASALLNNLTAKPALDLPGTDIMVATDATLFSDTDSTATYGDLAMADGVTVDLSGAPKGISFDVVSGNATVNLTDPDPDNEMRIRGGIQPGDSVGTLVVNGDLTVADGVVYEWELGPDGPDPDAKADHDLVEVAGTLTFDVGDVPEKWILELVDAGGEWKAWEKAYLFSGSPFETNPLDLSGDYLPYEIDPSRVTDWWEFTDPADLEILRDATGLYLFGLQTVPEPGTLVLLALGGLGLLLYARRRRRAR